MTDGSQAICNSLKEASVESDPTPDGWQSDRAIRQSDERTVAVVWTSDFSADRHAGSQARSQTMQTKTFCAFRYRSVEPSYAHS